MREQKTKDTERKNGIIVILNNTYYFDPRSQETEILLLTKSEMEKLAFGEHMPVSEEEKFDGIYKERGFSPIKSFVGRYVGNSGKDLKISPLHGLEGYSNNYFLIRKDQFKEIKRVPA